MALMKGMSMAPFIERDFFVDLNRGKVKRDWLLLNLFLE